MTWEYKKRDEKKTRDWFNSKVRKGESNFTDYQGFLNWYSQEKICYYCGLSEEESQEIVHKGLLTSNRFPLEGILSRGVNRGYWLEIDRKNPKALYSSDNCVLSCYFCNNDKSDVFDDAEYKAFKENRLGFLRELLNKKG